MTSFYYKTTKRHYEEGTTEVISTNKKTNPAQLREDCFTAFAMTPFYYNFKNKTTKRHYEEGTTEVISTNKKTNPAQLREDCFTAFVMTLHIKTAK